jgi:hypothetical protein
MGTRRVPIPTAPDRWRVGSTTPIRAYGGRNLHGVDVQAGGSPSLRGDHISTVMTGSAGERIAIICGGPSRPP